jgi:drug/metabolite transporter (DMT)-like permease
MSHTQGIILILISAFLHSTWHFLLKNKVDSSFQLFLISFFSSLISFVYLLQNDYLFNLSNLGILIFLSVIFHNLYKYFLLNLYKTEKFSDSYLALKGINFLLVIVLSCFFFKESISFLQIICIALIYSGLLFLYESRKVFKIKSILAGISMAAYTLLDVYLIRDSGDFFNMIFLLIFYDNLITIFYFIIFKKEYLNKLVLNFKFYLLYAPIFAISSFLIYMYVLASQTIAFTVILRETSIVFSICYGVIFMREKLNISKLIAFMLIISGIGINFL